MDPRLLIPEISTAAAAMQLFALAVNLTVAGAALAHAPGDQRTRVFFGIAVVNGMAAAVPIAFWFLGVKDPLAFGRFPLAFMLAALSASALLLFHFSQVFPRRRPWIRGAGIQLPVAYALVAPVVVALVKSAPFPGGESSRIFMGLFVVFGFPLLVLLGLVLPVASIVSLIRSYRETPATGRLPDARTPLAAILVSILASAALSVFVLGPLQTVAPESISVAIVTVAVWLLGLLTPVAFAAAVWRYRVLDIPIDRSAEVEAD